MTKVRQWPELKGEVTFSLSHRDWLIHVASERCDKEHPHHIDDCGEFEWQPPSN